MVCFLCIVQNWFVTMNGYLYEYVLVGHSMSIQPNSKKLVTVMCSELCQEHALHIMGDHHTREYDENQPFQNFCKYG